MPSLSCALVKPVLIAILRLFNSSYHVHCQFVSYVICLSLSNHATQCILLD